jgi:metallo-beta-lactamase family protein
LHKECFNERIVEIMETDPDPFGFNDLFFIQQVEDSKKLNDIQEPCIIISSSGMMEAGRVKHHLANSISNSRNTILAVGYCAPATLGARILRGDKEVSIFGTIYKVNADVERLDSYSGHADYSEMIEFLKCQDKSKIKQMILVHGDPDSQDFFRDRLNEAGYLNILTPELGNEIVV